MAVTQKVKIDRLKPEEWEEADRIFRLAFGTFLGMPDPSQFLSGRDFIAPRCRSSNVKALAARDHGRLIGSNLLTRWGSFGFFGPLTILPEYWDRGIAQQLLQKTEQVYKLWGVERTGLFTFPHSTKHIALYQKFGYWPQYLTALMQRTTEGVVPVSVALLSQRTKSESDSIIEACAALTGRISKDLDLSQEIRAVLAQKIGDVVLVERRSLDGFAVCMQGPGSEGGVKTCYVKFGAVRGGAGAAERFDRLLEACESFAAARGADVEAGLNLAHVAAYRQMRARGYKARAYGISMQKPEQLGHNWSDCWVIDDWR